MVELVNQPIEISDCLLHIDKCGNNVYVIQICTGST